MVVVITSIELKSFFKFFSLSYNALQIIRQLNTTSCIAYKSTGFWTSHYTMTMWRSAEEMKTFAKNGAHLEAMKKSASMAKSIRTLIVESEFMPSWREAKKMVLKDGKLLSFH